MTVMLVTILGASTIGVEGVNRCALELILFVAPQKRRSEGMEEHILTRNQTRPSRCTTYVTDVERGKSNYAVQPQRLEF